MNYRHIYHAGNFADIFKHFLLTLILEKLKEKETPFTVIDTHSGIGLYPLDSKESLTTQESEDGIGAIWPLLKEAPPLWDSFKRIIETFNGEKLSLYPGSPCWSHDFIRPQDRLWLCEKHPEDFEKLKDLFLRDKEVFVRKEDAWIALKAWLPPQEKRGLVFIDPPFEKPDEFDSIVKGIQHAMERFSHGIYAIWYPIKNPSKVQDFYDKTSRNTSRPWIALEWFLDDYKKPSDFEEEKGLKACGMLVINPPWQFLEKSQEGLKWLGEKIKAQVRIYEP
jgi:23S rRNA (adenine2030-N6)-methyltransferase